MQKLRDKLIPIHTQADKLKDELAELQAKPQKTEMELRMMNQATEI